jgi:cyanamide hydratase family protein with HD domain
MTIDDLVVPDTATSAAATEVASAYLSPALLNHSVRAYVWAAAYGTAQSIRFDPELLYVASMLHDIGLVPEFDSHTISFEDAGGHVARVFASGAGWPAERRVRLSEVIIRHMWPEVDVSVDPEGHLLARSTSVDVIGSNMDDFTPDFMAEVLERYPRLGFAEEFVACFNAQAERKPDSSATFAVRSGLDGRVAANPLDDPSFQSPAGN